MTEELLQFVWQHQLFNTNALVSTNRETIQIFKSGFQNKDSGPDFFNAKIKIGKNVWAGNVEIHTNSSDWIKHKHSEDKAYDNVILHVVYTADKETFRRGNKEKIPTIELKNRINKTIYSNYIQLKQSKSTIPCAKIIASVPSITINECLDRILVERLEYKVEYINHLLKLTKNNWSETFYIQIARYFGLKINTDPMELLAKNTPQKIVAKHKNNLLQLEALLFGQAGMLTSDFTAEYPQTLKKEYLFLKTKYNLTPLNNHLWKFFRLRPNNFPTIRISQFASLINKSDGLFSKIIEAENLTDLEKFFNVSASTYWNNHYQFEKKTKTSTPKKIGSSFIQLLLINVVIPFIFIYGKKRGEEKYCERALFFLENIKAEKNTIIDSWLKIGIKAKSAYQTQSLLQLKKEYCNVKKCLECKIGSYIIKS